jgi:polysaccharide export outer membrane protein
MAPTLVAPLSSCSTLPAAAPTAVELTATKDADNEPGSFKYSLVKLDARVVDRLTRERLSFGPTFVNAGHYTVSNALSPGDVIAITVYETGGPSLFPPPAVVPGAPAQTSPVGAVSTGASNIPPQIVEADGTVFIPFVGRMKVSGLTPGQAGAQIEQALQGKAVSPQVLVTLVNNIGNAATVNGEVNQPKSVPLSSRGERLLDIIAAAGGPKYPAYETYVQVMRHGVVGKVLMQTIINNPGENIIVRPRDQIYLARNPRTFAVFGATTKVSTYAFATEKVTLAEAIAQAGGPIDRIGDPSNIYLFRFEPWQVAKDILDAADIQAYEPQPPSFVPVLYRIDMRDAKGYFLTQAVQMRDKDVVLVTNAEATQLEKALAIVRQFTGIAYDLKRTDHL